MEREKNSQKINIIGVILLYKCKKNNNYVNIGFIIYLLTLPKKEPNLLFNGILFHFFFSKKHYHNNQHR